ncbi:MAG: hypothetical protein QUS14_18955, partial [Pyrinomonadaceae bacterium]|nr:hypothetical protein [Pyrinomonadaceae bacterium]
MINETHDPNLKSWVESANDPNTDFPIQNLPFCVFIPRTPPSELRIGVAIGDQVFDIGSAYEEGKLFEGKTKGFQVAMSAFDHDLLSGELMEDTQSDLREFRQRLVEIFGEGCDETTQKKVAKYLTPSDNAFFVVPSAIRDYTDFYSSIFHATNVGSMFRPDQPLMPNYKYVPIGYHGRASSIVISGTDIKRPRG